MVGGASAALGARSSPADSNECCQSPLRCRLACGGPAFAAELAQRQGWVLESQGGDLPERWRQRVEATAALQSTHRLELDVRGAARSDEVCVVGVREAVRVRAC